MTSIRTLVVEDDPLDQKAIARALQPATDYECLFAKSIWEARKLLEENVFDCAILDVTLPDGVVTELFKDLVDTPFIIATGAGSEEIAAQAFKQGAADYVIKDTRRFYLKLLPATVAKALKEKEVALLKKNLLGTISHEIRTPLTTLSIGLENLKEGLLGEINKEQKKTLNLLIEQAGRLSRIIEDVLDLSYFESGKIKMNFETFSALNLARQTIEEYATRKKTQNIRLHSEDSKNIPDVFADKSLIRRVLINLMDNALRFAKSTVEVRLSETPGLFQFCVEDDGPGIPKDQQKRLFAKFEQLARPKGGSGYKGMGLGLSICKEIVTAHGGKIWVDSETGQGTRFFFTIPLHRFQQRAKNENPARR